MSKVCIIGGGAAGMAAAIAAATHGNEVSIFEKNEKLGKKIFITGKGRCNLTNAAPVDVIMKNIVHNPRFMYSAFMQFDNNDIVSLLNEEGIETKVERGNRVFPKSDKAYDVTEGLKRRLKKLNVNVLLNTQVTDIATKDGAVSGVYTKKEFHPADCVIVATGGMSYPSTGSTGDGYKFAQKLGHTVTELLPSLVMLHTKEDYVVSLSGLSLKNVSAKFVCDNKVLYEEFGEMLFTHNGVSGPVILSGSAYVTKALFESKEVLLYIDLKPALDKKTLDARILKDFESEKNKNFDNSLDALLPKSLIPVIVKESGIDPKQKVNSVTKEEREKLVDTIKGLTLHITKTGDFNEAIITSGGVCVKEINPKTMESKLISGLYFAGEVLDVDALTGGFNLQIAWSSGFASGNNIY